MRCAVVGHTEWVEFVRVPKLPAAGEIVHAHRDCGRSRRAAGRSPRARSRASPGAASSSPRSATTRSDARATRRLAELGVDLHVQTVPDRRRGAPGRTSTSTASARSRCSARSCSRMGRCRSTATTRSSSPPVTSRRCARHGEARFLAATPRESPTLRAAGVPLDLLVGSLNDPGERVDDAIDAALVVQTDGRAWLRSSTASGFRPAPLPGPVVDTYGAGDSFAAALCFALARGDALPAAIELASRAGAAVITGQGPYAAQLTLGGVTARDLVDLSHARQGAGARRTSTRSSCSRTGCAATAASS